MLDHGVHGSESHAFITPLLTASSFAALAAEARRKSQPVSKVSRSANMPCLRQYSVILLSGAQHISQTQGLAAVLLLLVLLLLLWSLPLLLPLPLLLLLLLLLTLLLPLLLLRPLLLLLPLLLDSMKLLLPCHCERGWQAQKNSC